MGQAEQALGECKTPDVITLMILLPQVMLHTTIILCHEEGIGVMWSVACTELVVSLCLLAGDSSGDVYFILL